MDKEEKNMRQKDEQRELMLEYLSGELSEDDQERIEEKLFADDRYFEQMVAEEDALIDDYVQGRLAAAKREKFERFLRSSVRRPDRRLCSGQAGGRQA